MTSNALVVLVGVALCVCSPLSGGLAAPPPAPNKLLFDIASNKNICDVKNVIVESPYVRSCDEAKLPSDDRRLSVDDPKQFLCLAIYDRIATLCYLDSLTTKGNSVLPDKTSDFDARVANLTPSDPSKSWAFCEKPKNPYPPRNQNTTRYAMQLNTAMANPVLCVKMCTYSDGSFNPLCSVIVAIEDISLGIAVPSEKTPKHEAEEKAKTVEKERTEKAEEPIEQSTVDKPKEVTSKTVDKTKGTQPQTSIDKKEAEQLAKHSKSPAQTQPQHSAPASEITKPAVVPSPAPSIQTPQNVKEKKIKTPETAAQPPKQETDNIVSDKKTDAQPSLPKNPPLDPDNVPIAGEEALEGYLRGIGNVVPSPDDPESEVISEHTEGQEGQDIGGETSELEPPLILPNEQVEESPPVPSEKREFVPRMPSDEDTHFFGYFTVIGVICIAGYVGYHNKQKIFAMVLEGRRSRGGRGRRRPSTANYRKLDCTLEEAVTSQCNSNVTHVIY